MLMLVLRPGFAATPYKETHNGPPPRPPAPPSHQLPPGQHRRQAESGRGLADQDDTTAAEVSHRGWELVDVVTDPGLSGRTLRNRLGLLSVLDRLDRGEADVLVCSKLDSPGPPTGERLLGPKPARCGRRWPQSLPRWPG